MIRVAFNNTATYADAYYLKYNPSKLEVNSSENYVTIDLLDGGKIKQKKAVDQRPYILRWSTYPKTYSLLQVQLATLQAYIGTIKYVHFGTIDYGVPSLGWTRVIVTDLRYNIHSGGSVKYKEIELSLVPIES